MTLLKSSLIVIVTISFIIYFLANFISMKSTQEMEKPTPFECGFAMKSNMWTPFSMHFFLSALIFLIFDVELVLMFPYMMLFSWKISWVNMISVFFFVVLLSAGFFLEWSNKFLEWSN